GLRRDARRDLAVARQLPPDEMEAIGGAADPVPGAVHGHRAAIGCAEPGARHGAYVLVAQLWQDDVRLLAGKQHRFQHAVPDGVASIVQVDTVRTEIGSVGPAVWPQEVRSRIDIRAIRYIQAKVREHLVHDLRLGPE